MPIYRARLSAVGDCLSGVVGNDSYNSTVSLCFDEIKQPISGVVELHYTLKNRPRDHGFQPRITIHGSVEGPATGSDSRVHEPFWDQTKTGSFRFENLPNGDYNCCIGWTSDAWMS